MFDNDATATGHGPYRHRPRRDLVLLHTFVMLALFLNTMIRWIRSTWAQVRFHIEQTRHCLSWAATTSSRRNSSRWLWARRRDEQGPYHNHHLQQQHRQQPPQRRSFAADLFRRAHPLLVEEEFDSNHNNSNNNNPYASDFKVSLTGRNALSIELLDGGLCLESSLGGSLGGDDQVDDDDDDDTTIIVPEQVSTSSNLSAIQRAIQTTLGAHHHHHNQPPSTSSAGGTTNAGAQQDKDCVTFPGHQNTTIQKLDLFASHFRAQLTASMIANILHVLPAPLEQLQLGGILLSVPELCLLLAHPALSQLTHLALYDLEFTTLPDNQQEGLQEQQPEEFVSLPRPSLALQEVVAVFLRLEDHTVTLDPLLNLLTRAPQLKLLELVLDHNHAYIHGYPRHTVVTMSVQQQQEQHEQQNCLFSATAWAQVLQATQDHLETVILEYVPLTAAHFTAMADFGKSLKQLRLRNEPETMMTIPFFPTTTTTFAGGAANKSSNASNNRKATQPNDRIQALASLLQTHSSLELVSLDGMLSQTHETALICRVLNSCYNDNDDDNKKSNINSLRLRSVPMDLNDLNTLLEDNNTLHYLSLHNLRFFEQPEASKKKQGKKRNSTNTNDGDGEDDVDDDGATEHDINAANRTTTTNNSTTDTTTEFDNHTTVPEETVFATLVQVLRDGNNTTLRRISWKQAEFRRTEVFPRRRKPKAYRCFHRQHQHHNHQLLLQRRSKEKSITNTASAAADHYICPHQQLHWYLTLNQRGIRNILVDVNRTRAEFVQLIVDQQKQHQLQWQQLVLDASSLPMPLHDTQQEQEQEQQQPYRSQYQAPPLSLQSPVVQENSNSSNSNCSDDYWGLDCVYQMLRDNPCLCG